ncbi:MAG: hypothetical protein R2705_18240 [Ilumatobacteraceae bacterium]
MLTLVPRPLVRVLMVGLVLLTVQTTLLAGLRPFGISADIMLGAAVCAGVVAGAELGALAGFLLGLLFDLLLVSPLGLSAFSYGVAAFTVGAIKSAITVGQAWWLTAVLVFAGSAGGIVLFAVSGTLVGQEGWVQYRLLGQAVVVGGVNAVVAVPRSWLMKWAMRVEREA